MYSEIFKVSFARPVGLEGSHVGVHDAEEYPSE